MGSTRTGPYSLLESVAAGSNVGEAAGQPVLVVPRSVPDPPREETRALGVEADSDANPAADDSERPTGSTLQSGSDSGAEARDVLVVCTANQCRSPMAEGLIRHRLGDRRDVRVRSAGTWTQDGAPPTDLAIETMADRGIDIAGIRSEEVSEASIRQADLVLVMTSGHLEALEAEFPEARGKTMRISRLAGGAYDIVDPVGGTAEDYRATADELERLIDEGWDTITRGVASPTR